MVAFDVFAEADAIERLTSVAGRDELARRHEPGGVPALVVALEPGADHGALDAAAAHAPVVVVGVGQPEPAAPALDVLLTDDVDPPAPWVPANPDEVVAAVAASPQAALVLVQLLRLGRHRSVPEGLVAESLAYGLLQGGPVHAAWLRQRPPAPTPPTPSAPAVLVDRQGDELAITLNRPEVHNALDVRLRDELVEALTVAEVDPSITTVHLRGAGPSFCSGGDLREFGTVPDPVTGHVVRTLRSPAWALWRVADRVHAHLHGTCVGAGIELAALAGRVTAHPATTVRLPEVGFGLVPGSGGTASLPPRIGPARTAWLALTGATLDAATALRWGLIDAIDGDAPQ